MRRALLVLIGLAVAVTPAVFELVVEYYERADQMVRAS